MTEPQPGRASLDLGTPRDIGGLVRTGFNLYLQEFRTFLAIAAAVIVPVNLIVLGVGLGWFTAEFDRSPPAGETAIAVATSFLVTVPLLTAMCIHVLLDVSDGRAPSARTAIQRGLDVFAPLLLVWVAYAVAAFLGLFALILPGIWLLFRWVFCLQAVVVDGRRNYDALKRSGELVDGTWWRVAGIVIAVNFLTSGLSSLVSFPFLAAAEATDLAVFQLIGQTFGGVLFTPVGALITTLLYFDQRTRRGL